MFLGSLARDFGVPQEGGCLHLEAMRGSWPRGRAGTSGCSENPSQVLCIWVFIVNSGISRKCKLDKT